MTGLIEFEKNSIEQAMSEVFDSYGYGKPALDLLKSLSAVSGSIGSGVFLIGGFVRDIIIYILKSNPKTAHIFKPSKVFKTLPASKGNFNNNFLDLDIAVEGSAERLAVEIKKDKNFKFDINYLKIHKKFGTALAVFLIGNLPLKIDMASLRTEVYKKSGALPEVNIGNAAFKDDILRRDFTINAVAFSINGNDFLEVKDYAFGLSDILNKKIRVFHELSFIDDPTRMFRAVRFEKRLGFKIDRKTLKFIEIALNNNVLDNISGKRIVSELYLLLKEEKPEIYLERLEKLGILRGIYAELKFDDKKKAVFKRISSFFNKSGNAGKLIEYDKNIDPNIFYMAEVFYGLESHELDAAVGRLNLGDKIKRSLEIIYSDEEKILELKKNKLFNLNPKNSEIYDKLKEYDIKGILFYIFENKVKNLRDLNFNKIIIKYLNKLIFIMPAVGGRDLKSMGICEGPLCGKILNDIRMLKMNGMLRSKGGELKFIKKKYIKLSSGGTKND